MRVSVSCPGKFHAFHLTRQLKRHGMLQRFLTSDPRALLEPGLPLRKVFTFPASEAAMRLPRRWGIRPEVPWHRAKAIVHDHWARAALSSDADIVVSWSGSALRTLEKAKKNGALTIVERGSTHIAHQDEVLRDEYAREGVTLRPVHPSILRDELEEYALADRIMVPSTFARRTFLRRGVSPDRVLQVPYGADLNRFHPGTGPEDGVFRLVFVGGVSLRKGVKYLLEAVQRLRLPGAEVLIVGRVEAAMEPVLARYPGVAQVLGPRSQDEVAALLRRSSVFVFPSIEEGLSLALREALASGVPVIATDASGAEDCVAPGVDGEIVPVRDVEALMAAIEKLYRQPELRAEMARQAARRARGWTWDDYGARIAEVYTTERQRQMREIPVV